jgi:hypothetical protein
MRDSNAMPSTAKVSAVCFMVAQSDWLPMMMATGVFTGSTSCNDIGDQVVLYPDDLVLEGELLFLQPPKLQLVNVTRVFEGEDGVVKVTVFLLQNPEFGAQLNLFKGIHGMLPKVIGQHCTMPLRRVRQVPNFVTSS